MINSNLEPILHHLATIHPWQTTTNTQDWPLRLQLSDWPSNRWAGLLWQWQQVYSSDNYHRVCQKNDPTCFCQNFVKSPPNLTICGTHIAKMIKICKIHLMSTSPCLCQRTTQRQKQVGPFLGHPVVSTLPVLSAPSFDKAHADRAHSCQLVDSLKALIHRLSQQHCKLLIVEYLQVAACIIQTTFKSQASPVPQVNSTKALKQNIKLLQELTHHLLNK